MKSLLSNFTKTTSFLVVLLGLHFNFLSAQSNLHGIIKDEKGQPVSFANVLLLTAADSSLFRGAVAGDNGHFEINNVVPGSYMLRISMIGMVDYFSDPFTLTENSPSKDFGGIVIHEDAVLMNAVEVVAKKPLFEQKIDRLVINVANSITSSGTNALEVLERTPGVVVNHQSNTLSISGKNGVVVMINGRINYMPADAVVRLLAGMSSDNIERIEVITTPPAGFDAEGNAGYINIVLKKSLDDGLNGSVGLSLGYGKGEQINGNLNFNYRQGKINLYGDYSYTRDAAEQIFEFYRRIGLNGDILETDTRSVRDPGTNNHNARLGLDYQLDKKTIVGILVDGYDTKWEMDARNTSFISRNGHLDTSIVINNQELNQWKHIGANLNIQHTFAEGRQLTFDANILSYKDNNPTEYENIYSDGEGNFLFTDHTRAHKLTPINIKVGKIDYNSGIGKKMKLETGIKGTVSHFTNDVGVDYLTGQDWNEDPMLTAKYDLNEDILAGYASIETPVFAGINLKAGLRYEHTNSNLGSAEQPDIVDRQFGEWFPSVFLSKDFNENNSVNLAYSKRITRPTFDDMAPFIIFLDPSTFFSGNPALQPATSDNFKIGIRHKSILFSVEYSVEDSSIAQFQSSVIEGTNKQLLFAENLKDTKTVNFTLTLPVTPVKWWNMSYNIIGGTQTTRKYFNGKLTSFDFAGFGFFSSQTITLPADFTFEATGYYGSGGLFGVVAIKAYGAINVGLQKKFGESGGTLRMGYDDLLNSQKFTGESDLPELNQFFKASLRFSQPTFKISFTQNFGNQKVKSIGEHKSGAEEERGRVKQQ
ncbi:MAG TPA: outer membrane beta-barrel protein [Saprospiraceae bacterium]|nr:outer membrane beta-barrel protein [Saprospiraceae bacterium]